MPHVPPGRLRKEEDPDLLLMIGTAGHVDHGKTRLVRLLTGCETDRLKEEKLRGMSIELGFAPCRLSRGLAAGIVDVPGHEQFVKNMVAGASGMDLAVLVIAADDGVMPQTVEHLQIMQFMGVQKGMVALSKIDLVSPERIEEVKEQIAQLAQGTFLEGAPICPFSSETLEGFGPLYNTLVATALEAKIERREGVFRMPVERVFSPPGFGTVATGIPFAGRIALGDEVEIHPGGKRARVRGIQRFLRDAAEGHCGQCLALNLAGLPLDAVARGSVVARPGYVTPNAFLAVVLFACRDLSLSLRSGQDVRLHTGTLEAQARLNLFDRGTLERGGTALGALHLSEPLPVCPGDRFVIRLNSPSITVAGGVVLRSLPHRPKGSRASLADELRARWASFASIRSRMEYHFSFSSIESSTLHEAAVELLIEEDSAKSLIVEMQKEGVLVACPPERWLHREGWEQAQERLSDVLDRFHRERPADYGPLLAEAAKAARLPLPVAESVAESLKENGCLERREGRLRLAGKPQSAETGSGQLQTRVEKIYLEGKFATPRPDELPALLNVRPAEAAQALDFLCRQGTLVRLGKNVVFHRQWMREAETIVVREIESKGQLDSGEFKDSIGSSRKYALALLDHFDTIHVTLRSDNLRWLHPEYRKKRPQGYYL